MSNIEKSISRFKPKPVIQKILTMDEMITAISAELEAFPNKENLMRDINFILYACLLIERVVHDCYLKVNKMEVLLSIFSKIYDLKNDDRVAIRDIVQFLHGNGLIKLEGNIRYIIIQIIKKIVELFNS